MAVTYDYYRIFYYVAKYQSFTRAAKILMSNQPNITRAMNNLERELACRLFIRSNRGVTLTPEGKKLFDHVQIAQEQLQAGEYELSGKRNLEEGNVAISASETALHGLLLPVLQQFHLVWPGIRIQIHNHSTPQAVAAVKSGLVELAVVTSPTGAARTLREVRLKKIREILIAGKHFEELAKRRISIKELTEYPLVCLGRETKTYEFYSQIFSQYGAILHPDIEAATADQILPMVRYDLGLGFLPDSLAKEALEEGEVFQVELKETIPSRYICLIKDSGRPLSLAAKELEKLIRGAGDL
ncbi:LysR family transcriptional regulator [Roseburia hominis]